MAKKSTSKKREQEATLRNARRADNTVAAANNKPTTTQQRRKQADLFDFLTNSRENQIRRRNETVKQQRKAGALTVMNAAKDQRFENKPLDTIGLRTDRPKLNMKYIGGGGAERDFDPDKGYEDKKLTGKPKVSIDDLLGNIKKQQTDTQLATARRAGAMQGADNVKPTAGQNAKGTDDGRTFLQRSAEAQITNPNSRMNQVYRWRASAPSKTGNTEQDIRNYAAWQQEGQKLRMYDMGSDVGMWSDEKLAREIANEQKKAAEAAGARPETEEDRQALRVRGKEIREEKGAYTSLGVNGLEDWRHNRHIFEKPEDYEDDETYYDGLLWDAAHNVYDEKGNVREGKTRYVDILQNGTDEEADAVVDEVENLWTRLQDGSIIRMAEENEDLLAEERSIDAAFGSYDDSYLNSLLQEQGNRQQQNALIAGATGSGAYEAGNLPGAPQLRMTTEGDDYYYVPGDKTDEAYFQINNSWRTQQESAFGSRGVTENVSKALDQGYHWSQARNEWFLTDEEKQVFNKYYNSGDKANAQAFLDGLQSSLNARRTTYEQTDMRQRAAGPLGFLEGAATVPVNIAAGFAGIYNTIAAAVGNEDARDPNSKNWTLQRYIGTTRDERGNQWAQGFEDAFGDGAGDVGKFVYGVTMSMADNIAAMATAGGVAATVGIGGLSTRAAQAIVQLIMSGEATSATMLEQLENGKDPLEAALMAAGSGLIEAITEKYSLDALLKTNPSDLLGDARMIGRYLRRNAITEGSEEIVSDLLNTTLDEIMSMIRGHKSEIRIKIDQLVDEGMTEEDATRQASLEYWGQVGLSGAAGALSGLLLSGGNVASNMFTQNAIGSRVRETEKKTGKTASFVETILGMDKETRSYKLANKIREAEQSGKTPSNRQIGQLVQNAVMESSQKDTEANRNVQESVAEAVGIKTRKPAFVADYASVGEQMAKEDDIREAEDNQKENGLPEITGSRKVIVLGEYGKVKGLVQTKAGLKYAVDVNGTENLVEASDIRATDFATAAVIRNQATNPGLYSQGYTNQLLQEIESGSIQDAGRFLAEATSIRLAAHTGAELPKTSMPAEMAQRLYNLTKTEYAQTRQRETAADQRNAKGRGQGRATFKGAQYGTDAFVEKIAGLTKTQQDRINAYAELAKQAGVELTFLDNADIEAQGESFADRAAELYGTESKAGIELNIEGENIGLVDGKRTVTGRHHIGVAFGHEMTHYLQRNSLEGYNRLEKFVLDTLRQKNGNSYVNQRILDVMQSQGLDIAGAMSEIVADSCDQILGSESLMKHIQETDQTLFGKIRDFVRSLVDRLRNAAQNMSESASWDARQMMGHVNELARIWLGAYDEVLSGVTSTETAETGDGNVRKSIADVSNQFEYMKSFEEQLEDFMNVENREKLFGRDSLMVGPTPKLLRDIGLPALPMAINQEHVEYALEGNYPDAAKRKGHKFDKNEFAKLPDKIADPVAVVYETSSPKELVIFVDMVNTEGDKVIVPMRMGATRNIAGQKMNTNALKTVYARDNGENLLRSAIANDTAEKNTLFYLNKEKALNLALGDDTKTIVRGARSGIIHRINQKGSSVNTDIKEQTETKQFRKWFKGSKVVDENGDPLIVYHGTSENFTVFDMDKGRANMDIQGAFFSPWEEDASGYGENVGSFYLSIKNPAPENVAYKALNRFKGQNYAGRKAREYLIGQGYDGVINGVEGQPDEIIAFYPEQIKSATDNVGTFDKNNQDIRYSLADPDVRKYLNNWARDHVEELQDMRDQLLGGRSGRMAEGVASAADRERLRQIDREIEKWEQRRVEAMGLDEDDLGAQYITAWKHNDTARMEEILMEKLSGTDGVIPYKAPVWYDSERHRQIANLLKEKNPEAVMIASVEMAALVPKNAVLIPMPPHTGSVTEETDTMVLARAISNLTHRPVLNALEGAERERRQDTKQKKTGSQVRAEQLGFRQIAEIPEGMIPYFIDNVVGSGVTAQAAHDAIGSGITLAYAKSTRAAIGGLKNAAATYTDRLQTRLIPLDDRFDMEMTGVKGTRYSRVFAEEGFNTREEDGTTIISNQAGEDLIGITESGSVSRYSYASYYDKNERGKMIAALQKAGFSERQIKKWIADTDSIAAIIATDRTMYDFVADRTKKFLKPNGDVYKKTLDASTMCKKTRLFNGTFNVVQHLMPNTVLMPEDLIDLYNQMKDMNLETPCGFCYVQSRRRLLGSYTEEWLDRYKGEYVPSVDEVTTSDGLERLKKEHPKTYQDFVRAMNRKGVNNPKLVQQRTDYRGEIRKLKKETIRYLKEIGGLRIQSFSDFETVHMLDMMQAVLDMKAMGLTAQAYTKVPDFAWIFGNTGIKINLSLVGRGTGLDANGNLVFDNDEGMPFDEAMRLRNAYSKNVGTIIVGINDDHIIACMGDDRIDFIIPFHKSGWSKAELERMRTLGAYSDYTDTQNEYNITGTDENGKLITAKADSNIDPLSYWEFEKNGQYNAEKYLEICKERKIVPKFPQFLVDNGDGSFSLPQGSDKRSTNIREGYWKTLIDFKMYDNSGKGSRQTLVQPNFNMEKATEILKAYDGSHRQLPESWEAARAFVDNYKKNHPLDEVRTRYSQADTSGADVNMWMSGLTAGSLQTEDERQLLQSWKDLRMQIQLSLKRQLDYKEKLKRLQNAETLTPAERDDMTALQNRIEIQRNKQEQLENELAKVTSSDGYAGMMYRQNAILQDFIYGRTQEQVRDAVDAMVAEVDQLRKEINAQAKELDKLRNAESVKKLRKLLNEPGIKQMSDMLKAEYKSGMGTNEIGSRLAEMALRQMQGQDTAEDVRQLAEDLINKMRGISNDALESLRGRTLVIGEEQLNRLKAENTNLREIRSQLKGSGVRIAVQERSRLQEQWAELRETNQALPDIDALEDADAVHAVVDYISQAVKNNGAVEMFGIDMQEVEGMVQAAQGVVMTYLTDNAEARTQIRAAMDSRGNGSLTGIRERMNSIVQAGQKAKSWTTVLEKDVDQALEYYNKTARLAAREEKRKVREGLIAQLKSEHTGELIRQRMKFEQQMKEDRKARHLAEDNKALRSKINTVTKRLAKLITAETDQKNIPEEAKPLARILLRLITRNDLNGHRKITGMDHDQLANISRVLDVLDNRNGEFKPEDLDWLITGEGENADYEIRDKVAMDLQNIESGILEYITAEGKRNITLQDRKNALTRIQTAASEIMDVIAAKQKVEINGRKMWAEDLAFRAEDDMQKSRFKGEWTGGLGKIIGKLRAGVMLGNMTPEYFFRFLHNDTLSLLFDEYHNAENRAGLEYGKAKDRIAQIAEEAGYSTWDLEKKYAVKLASGGTVQLNIEQMLQLYATWKREEALQAGMNDTEKTYHLSKGGFYVENDAAHKIAGREIFRQRAYRMKAEDIATLESLLTPQQIKYAEDIVSYLSNEMSQLGNEASMRMYGIKKYNEKYYFPFEIWSGVKAVKSDTGAGGNQESHRAARPGFSNRLRNNANNALMIRGFTQTATRHIVGMINYNTFAPAIENTQRVMNAQTLTGEGDNQTKRNLWAVFGEAYGKDALDYFQNFQKELNGGATRVDRTFYDKLMSTFRKSAVAGSLSVSLQQPLSYIRASIMINPKYLAEAINPVYWKGSLKEMQEYSGVAVLKDMGKFDMGIGQSAQQFLTPDAKQGRIRTGYEWMSEKTTILPTLMDNMTWTRMWTACKLEQHALHPEMDMSSKEFLETVAKRFNDVLRKTQVYDSTLVRSRNMRSNNPIMKGLTSFMAEPTLTLNVLADAVMNAKEKGGKAKLAAAGAAFMLSAVAQALVKGLMGAGRTPDDKKTFEENVAYRFWYNFLNEANPLSLIPGYSDMITLLKKGELSDDAMNVFGKIFAAGKKLWNIGDSKNVYRDLEDSAGVLAQLFTNIPVKNLSRDARAMYNFFEQPYADRLTSSAVLKYQAIDQTMTADNLLGAINAMTGSGIYNTGNTAYYQRIMEAEKENRARDAEDMREYLTAGKGVKEDTLADGQKTALLAEYKKGSMTRERAEEIYKRIKPEESDKNRMKALDKVEWGNAGNSTENYSAYMPLYAAIESNKQEEINAVARHMMDNGFQKADIRREITNEYKPLYLAATGKEKDQLRIRIIKGYKSVGYTETEAIKMINSWKEK